MYVRSRYTFLFVLLSLSCHKTETGGPSIIGISPNNGLGGNLVTITGKGFDADPTGDQVAFNGVTAQVIEAAGNQLVVQVPNGATTGPVTVMVNGRTVTGPVYTVTAMSISSISPTAGKAGTKVTITGQGLVNTGKLGSRADNPTVYFNGRLSLLDSATPTTLVVTVPDSAGYGPITVQLDSVKLTGPEFYYFGLNSMHPQSGNVGTRISLTGGFGANPARSVVTIAGQPMLIDSASPGKLIVTVLAGDTTGHIIIDTGGAKLSSPLFQFVPPPAVSGIVPNSGPAGTKVIITGTNFSLVPTEDTVFFNGTAVTPTASSGTQLTVRAPAGALSGPVSVHVNGQPSAPGPVYTYQPLGIVSVSPVNGVAPLTMTISGFGFGNNAAGNVVTINGTAYPIATCVDTAMTVNVAVGVTTGSIVVQANGYTDSGFSFTATEVGTFAGGSYGLANGVGVLAQFETPAGLAFDQAGNLYVADQAANNIRKIAPDGTVTNFAGDPNGAAGFVNGQGAAARFSKPEGLVFDPQGNLYVADFSNGMIRKITPDGTVSTFVSGQIGQPWGLAADAGGNIYVSNYIRGTGPVYEYDPNGNLISSTSVDVGPVPDYANLESLVIDNTGNVYVIDANDDGIWQNGNVWYYVFLGALYDGSDKGLCLDKSGNLVIANGGTNQILVLNPQTMNIAVVTGGNGSSTAGFANADLATSLFNYPVFVTVDAAGNIYVSDQGNHAIRKIAWH